MVTSHLHQSTILILLLTMVVCIILGMGMPAPAAYLITAVLTAPAVVSLGVPLLSAHLFCLYFAIVSFITPPVAVAAYAAAGISGADLSKTGWTALRLGMCAFVIPFAFIYKPSVLLLSSWVDILFGIMTTLLGVLFLSGGIVGYFITTIQNVFGRGLLIICGILLIAYPHWLGAVVGLLVGIFILMPQFYKKSKLEVSEGRDRF